MRFRVSAVAGFLALTSTGALAQGGGASAHPSCSGVAADACQQAIDFFQYMAPQLGTAMTGGNTTLAQGGTLGGRRFGLVPKFAVGVRLNAVMGNHPVFAPAAQLPTASAPPAARKLSTETIPVPLPAVDAAIGIFKGIPLALSNVGGVDVLLSAAYVPKRDIGDVSLNPEKSLEFGYGARIGLLQESLVVPGLGVSYMVRKFPVTDITVTQTGSSLAVNDLDLQSTAWRLTASKSLLLFGIALGVGQDTYKSSTSITATMGGSSIATPAMESKVTRTNYFGDLSMNLVVLKLVASGGMVSGGKIPTYNSFDNAADKSRLYGSVGVRFGL